MRRVRNKPADRFPDECEALIAAEALNCLLERLDRAIMAAGRGGQILDPSLIAAPVAQFDGRKALISDLLSRIVVINDTPQSQMRQ